jgi:hypothetical protein
MVSPTLGQVLANGRHVVHNRVAAGASLQHLTVFYSAMFAESQSAIKALSK